MRFLFLFLFLVLSASALGEELPFPSEEASQVAKATEGLVWNKWETDNFVILSIDFDFGDAIRSSLELERSSVCAAWGVDDSNLPVKCKLVCVPDKKLLRDLFAIDRPECEIRRGESSGPKEMAIWLDQGSVSSLRGLLLSVSLHGAPPCVQRGVDLLASSDADKEIASLSSPSFAGVFSSTSESVRVMAPKDKTVFDKESATLCLFVRREFGARAFSGLSKGTSPEYVCGFPDEKSFAETISRYFVNLKEDLQSGRTPASYLEP